MNLSFENINYLWALPLLAALLVLFFRTLKWKSKVKKSLGDERLLKRLTRGYSEKRYKLKFYFVAIALFIGIFAAMGLRSALSSGNKDASAGIDIIIALDVSKSMLSQDIKPTRLDRAKQLIGKLTDNLYNNRVGFVVFAGQAVLQMPLTDDVGAIKMYLSNINTDAVQVSGTVVSDALLTADNALDAKDKKHKAVILITDGEDHESVGDAITKLSNDGVTVYTIGVGTASGSPIIDPATGEEKKDKDGNTIISKLNEKELREIAEKTGGAYVLLDNDATVISAVTAKINSMEKKLIETGDTGSRNYFYYFPVLIAIVLLLLLVEIFIPERKKYLA
jgi:Ca-activated chloride channel family protein